MLDGDFGAEVLAEFCFELSDMGGFMFSGYGGSDCGRGRFGDALFKRSNAESFGQDLADELVAEVFTIYREQYLGMAC